MRKRDKASRLWLERRPTLRREGLEALNIDLSSSEIGRLTKAITPFPRRLPVHSPPPPPLG
eukprot:5085641-Pleurochrysis_carterae.AAC.2